MTNILQRFLRMKHTKIINVACGTDSRPTALTRSKASSQQRRANTTHLIIYVYHQDSGSHGTFTFTTMTGITIQLIDALLNPSQDRSAETHYQSIILPSRVLGLFSLLSQSEFQTQPNIDANDVARCMLTCVLLRRDISCLGGYAIQNSHQIHEIVQMLAGMVNPMLECLSCQLDMNSGSTDATNDKKIAPIKRQIRFVMAEVCSILSLMDEAKAKEAVNATLSNINEMVCRYSLIHDCIHTCLKLNSHSHLTSFEPSTNCRKTFSLLWHIYHLLSSYLQLLRRHHLQSPSLKYYQFFPMPPKVSPLVAVAILNHHQFNYNHNSCKPHMPF